MALWVRYPDCFLNLRTMIDADQIESERLFVASLPLDFPLFLYYGANPYKLSQWAMKYDRADFFFRQQRMTSHRCGRVGRAVTRLKLCMQRIEWYQLNQVYRTCNDD